jgi:hypothetical protein
MKLYLAGQAKPTRNYRYLGSWWYLRDDGAGLRDYLKRSGSRKAFLDSGAYTGMIQGFVPSVMDYLAFAIRHQHIFHVCANMDVGTVKEQQQHQAILDRHLPCVLPVIHPEEARTTAGREWFEAEIRDRDYVALGGLVGSPKDKKALQENGFFSWLFSLARKHNTKVHGFGVTTIDLMLRWPFYSVDSSSWLSGVRYGVTPVISRTGIRFKQANKSKSEVSEVLGKLHIRGVRAQILDAAIGEYEKLEKVVTDSWAMRGVTWPDPDPSDIDYKGEKYDTDEKDKTVRD